MRAILTTIPPGFLDGLESDVQDAVKGIVGKPVTFAGHDQYGHAELEFIDKNGINHSIWVDPAFVSKVERWNVELVDYHSDLFDQGFEIGKNQTTDAIIIPPRRPEWSDAQWATFAEAVLMGACERDA